MEIKAAKGREKRSESYTCNNSLQNIQQWEKKNKAREYGAGEILSFYPIFTSPIILYLVKGYLLISHEMFPKS